MAEPDQSLEPPTRKSTIAQVIQSSSPTKTSAPVQRGNKNGPAHRFQTNQHLLYEKHFYGDTYISAHLQRLQNGIFSHMNIHNEHTKHVSFIAITFCFHSSYDEHRVKGAVVSVAVEGVGGESLRVIKFAPHQSFGRISSATLKWNFCMGASVGVTEGPARASLDPQLSYEKDNTIGKCMKIQGSTRSTISSTMRQKADTMVVWSLEEDALQQNGIPSEFTFVFLVERPMPKTPETINEYSEETQSIASDATLNDEKKFETLVGVKAINGADSLASIPGEDSPKVRHFNLLRNSNRFKDRAALAPAVEASIAPEVKFESQVESSPSLPAKSPRRNKTIKGLRNTLSPVRKPETSPHIKTTQLETKVGIPQRFEQPAHGFIHEIQSFSNKITNKLPVSKFHILSSTEPRKYSAISDSFKSAIITDGDYGQVFSPIHIRILVKPRIEGAADRSVDLLGAEWVESIVAGQIGQRFFDGDGTEDQEVNGLFNFATMEGTLEDMVEMPGRAVTTIEPNLDDAKK